jgi:hypothetical protein
LAGAWGAGAIFAGAWGAGAIFAGACADGRYPPDNPMASIRTALVIAMSSYEGNVIGRRLDRVG